MIYKGVNIASITLLMIWSACLDEADRFNRLERDFVQICPQPAYFTIVAKEDTLILPVPAGRPPLEPERISAMLDVARGIPEGELSVGDRAILLHIRKVLGEAKANRRLPWYLDLEEYCLDELLRHFADDRGRVRHPDLLVTLVENIPVYYARVHDNWGDARKSGIQRSVERNLEALALLDSLDARRNLLSVGYRERLERAGPAARMAIKDYMALCQSSLLE